MIGYRTYCAGPAALEHLDVGTADAGGADADEDLPRPGSGLGTRCSVAAPGRSTTTARISRLTAVSPSTATVERGPPLAPSPSLKRKIPVCVRGCSAHASWSRCTPRPGPVGTGKQPSTGSTAGAASTSSLTPAVGEVVEVLEDQVVRRRDREMDVRHRSHRGRRRCAVRAAARRPRPSLPGGAGP